MDFEVVITAETDFRYPKPSLIQTLQIIFMGILLCLKSNLLFIQVVFFEIQLSKHTLNHALMLINLFIQY